MILLAQETEEKFSHGELLMVSLNLSSTMTTAQLAKQNFTETIF